MQNMKNLIKAINFFQLYHDAENKRGW